MDNTIIVLLQKQEYVRTHKCAVRTRRRSGAAIQNCAATEMEPIKPSLFVRTAHIIVRPYNLRKGIFTGSQLAAAMLLGQGLGHGPAEHPVQHWRDPPEPAPPPALAEMLLGPQIASPMASGLPIACPRNWWWNEVVQGKVEAKKAAYLNLVGRTCEVERSANRERYKVARKEQNWRSQRLSLRLLVIYTRNKARERKAQNQDQVRCIKDEDGRVLMGEAQIKRRWKTYFHKRLNEKRDWDIVLGELGHSESLRDFRYCRRIKVREVMGAMRKMSRGRATGPDEISIEFWMMKRIPDEWRHTVVLLYKNKGDIQSCNNYRGIKLSHTMKVWKRVVEARVRRTVSVSDNQFGFMPGHSTMKAIHLVRREIKDMYDRAKTRVSIVGGDYEHFPVVMGLHQGSALSPFLFALVMDALTDHVQGKVPWCMLFTNDNVLVDKTQSGVNERLEV
ncbi:PREDICTED: uncharacterized protein LOC109205891 [Nicotiana attenuata]|uniref:uncharacterized protein LOC109205891 n=1 Tax=Nicotiana attenuata TaxID=49451 RepID=UPI000904C50F|nr:PREDICTED: uncharacterized protein LOC109205891 [Nicotiana attenuata]